MNAEQGPRRNEQVVMADRGHIQAITKLNQQFHNYKRLYLNEDNHNSKKLI